MSFTPLYFVQVSAGSSWIEPRGTERLKNNSLLSVCLYPCIVFTLCTGRYSTTFYAARFRPEIQPFTLLYNVLDKKRYPFRIPSIHECYLLNISSSELPLNPTLKPWAYITSEGVLGELINEGGGGLISRGGRGRYKRKKCFGKTGSNISEPNLSKHITPLHLGLHFL